MPTPSDEGGLGDLFTRLQRGTNSQGAGAAGIGTNVLPGNDQPLYPALTDPEFEALLARLRGGTNPAGPAAAGIGTNILPGNDQPTWPAPAIHPDVQALWAPMPTGNPWPPAGSPPPPGPGPGPGPMPWPPPGSPRPSFPSGPGAPQGGPIPEIPPPGPVHAPPNPPSPRPRGKAPARGGGGGRPQVPAGESESDRLNKEELKRVKARSAGRTIDQWDALIRAHMRPAGERDRG